MPEDELLRRLARSSGLGIEEVRWLVRLEIVVLDGGTVRPALLRRLRKVRRLRRDLGLDLDVAVIVLRLLDRIEALEGARQRPGGVRVVDEPPA